MSVYKLHLITFVATFIALHPLSTVFFHEILACQMLIETAAKLWQREEGDYRDDVSNKHMILR